MKGKRGEGGEEREWKKGSREEVGERKGSRENVDYGSKVEK